MSANYSLIAGAMPPTEARPGDIPGYGRCLRRCRCLRRGCLLLHLSVALSQIKHLEGGDIVGFFGGKKGNLGQNLGFWGDIMGFMGGKWGFMGIEWGYGGIECGYGVIRGI